MHYKRIRCNWLAIFFVITFCNIQFANAGAVKISGVLEAEVGMATDYDDITTSDIVHATVEIGLDVEISEWVSGHILALYEEEDATGGPLNIDEATITFGNEFLSAHSLVVGQQYLPFGFFETNMISDPLTLEIGETADSAITYAYDEDINFAAYLFNGDVNKLKIDPINNPQDEKIDKFGINIGYVFEGDTLVLDVGVGYINSLGDSNGLGDTINNGAGGVTKFIPGVASHLLMEWGSFVFIVDHVFATDEFAAQEILGVEAKPSAANIEIALNVTDDATLAFGVQQTVDLAGLFPESRVLMAVSYGLSDNTGVAVEFLFDEDYSLLDGGSGEKASAFTVQVASEF